MTDNPDASAEAKESPDQSDAPDKPDAPDGPRIPAAPERSGTFIARAVALGRRLSGLGALSKELVWRGMAKGTLSAKSQKNEKKFRKAVQKLFRQLPPS